MAIQRLTGLFKPQGDAGSLICRGHFTLRELQNAIRELGSPEKLTVLVWRNDRGGPPFSLSIDADTYEKDSKPEPDDNEGW